MHCFYATLAVCVNEVNIHSGAQLIITLSHFNRITLYLYSTVRMVPQFSDKKTCMVADTVFNDMSVITQRNFMSNTDIHWIGRKQDSGSCTEGNKTHFGTP